MLFLSRLKLGMAADLLRILLIGSGGREHAIAWKLARSPSVEKIYVVPGNGGTAAWSNKISNIDDTPAEDYLELVSLAQKLKINLVVPSPDVPIIDGIEGFFRAGRDFSGTNLDTPC